MIIFKVFFWGFIILVGIVITFGLIEKMRISNTRQNEKLQAKQSGAIADMYATSLMGLNIPAGISCRILLYKDYLLISSESNSFKLATTKIKGAYVKSEEEILQEEKSVVGRAIIGGIALGGLGAIIGAISGIGTKQQNIDYQIFTVIYNNSALVFRKSFEKGYDARRSEAWNMANLITTLVSGDSNNTVTEL